jgi:hypothetical protein
MIAFVSYGSIGAFSRRRALISLCADALGVVTRMVSDNSWVPFLWLAPSRFLFWLRYAYSFYPYHIIVAIFLQIVSFIRRASGDQ